MAEDETQIQTLVREWARAVHAGDLNGVLARHARDIVMFDVPPPHDGVRGIDAYRETWPPFFEWQLAANPDQRLRLTLGLRKEDGDWVVAHEHHSFADLSA